MRIDSRAVHAGREPRSREPLAPPIVQTSVYVYNDLDDYDDAASGRRPGHFYTRNSNENTTWLGAAVADLEGAEAGLTTSSGMSALLVSILALAPKPVPIVAQRDLYGVTLSLLRQDLGPAGYELRLVDADDHGSVARALDGSGLLLLETLTNPLCRVADLAALGELAAARGVPMLVDNTFATPILCRPLELGAAAVVHSLTKFLAGHNDVTAGALAGPEAVVAEARARSVRMGTNLSPFEAWLAHRGLRTLAVRMRAAGAGALAVAQRLASLERVQRVHYPLLEGSPYEAVARRQFDGGGGAMLAFDLAGGRPAVQAMMERLRMVSFAASLGGVETTISHPEVASHRSLSPQERAGLGISGGTVRVSIGIEAAEDIAADFEQAIGG